MFPDDSLGVAVVTTLDAANIVTSRIAEAALRAIEATWPALRFRLERRPLD